MTLFACARFACVSVMFFLLDGFVFEFGLLLPFYGAIYMKSPFVRSAYNYEMDDVSRSTGLECKDLSLAVQDQRDEVDINTIVRRFGLTGQLPTDVKAPQYGDFSEVLDYQSALHAVMEADAAFMKMPADVRSRFDNDPGLFVDFCSDEKNRDELKKMGLLAPPAPDPAPLRLHPDDLDRLNKVVPGEV